MIGALKQARAVYEQVLGGAAEPRGQSHYHQASLVIRATDSP
jgi:hypothetical protein